MPRVEANGIELEMDERGEGPPLVLIMGIGAQMTLWPEGLLDALADRGLRVIRFDNRDIGLSTWLDHHPPPPVGPAVARALLGRPAPAPYSLWDMADDTAGLLDALDLPHAHIFGVSMGGMVAQCLAIRHPDRLRSLISMMSTTGQRRVSLGRPTALAALFGKRPRTRDEVIDTFLTFSRVVSGSAYPPDEDEVRRQAGELFDRAHHPAGFARHMAAILATGDRTAGLRGVRTPSLVLHGDEDPLVPLAGGRATAAAIPGATLSVLPGLGHHLPEAVWPALADQVAAHVRAADAG
jgi:pimeloyl-ACP methyl ester carboxylesterase